MTRKLEKDEFISFSLVLSKLVGKHLITADQFSRFIRDGYLPFDEVLELQQLSRISQSVFEILIEQYLENTLKPQSAMKSIPIGDALLADLEENWTCGFGFEEKFKRLNIDANNMGRESFVIISAGSNDNPENYYCHFNEMMLYAQSKGWQLVKVIDSGFYKFQRIPVTF